MLQVVANSEYVMQEGFPRSLSPSIVNRRIEDDRLRGYGEICEFLLVHTFLAGLLQCNDFSSLVTMSLMMYISVCLAVSSEVPLIGFQVVV